MTMLYYDYDYYNVLPLLYYLVGGFNPSEKY